ncbi:hypothetical protein BsWGS_20498 [Bradybaena similaris]
MDSRKERRRIQNKEAAQKSYKAKKDERETLQQKNSELTGIQISLLNDKCRLEEQLKVLEDLVKNMEHVDDMCLLSQVCAGTQVTPKLAIEKSINEDTRQEVTNNNVCSARDVIDLTVDSQLPTVASIVPREKDVPKTSSIRPVKTKPVTLATKLTSSCEDYHILDPSSYLAIGAEQDVYPESPNSKEENIDTDCTSSSSEDEVFLPPTKTIQQNKTPVRGFFTNSSPNDKVVVSSTKKPKQSVAPTRAVANTFSSEKDVPSAKKAKPSKTIFPSSSPDNEVSVSSAKKIKQIKAPVSRPLRGCASDVLKKQFVKPFADSRGNRFSAS